MADDPQDCVGEVGSLFFLFDLNRRVKSCIVFAEVSKEAPLEGHLNCSARYPTIFVGQANDFIESDLVAAGVVDVVLAVREIDCAGI